MIYSRIFWLSLFFVAFSARAESVNFTLSHLSLTFFLGITIPVLGMALWRSLSNATIFVFPSLLCITLLFFIGCISQDANSLNQHSDHLWLCSAANAYLCLLFLMPNRSDWLSELLMPRLRWLTVSIVVLFVVFETSLFVLPDINHNLTWLAWFMVTALIAYIRGYMLVRSQASSFIWLMCALGVTLSSGTMFWLWLNGSIDEGLFYLVIGIGYTMVLAHFTYTLIRHSSAENESGEISHEDWQLYARDAVTNFPLQGQATKKLEYALLNNEHQKLAAIAFKPVNFAQANKILGYENSDALLLQLAYSMQKQSLKIDRLVNLSFADIPFYVARLHSLHFLIVADLTDNKYDDNEVVEHICQQLISALPQAMTFKSYTMNFELAFGVSMLAKGDSSVKQAVTLAEDALLKAEQLNQSIYFVDQSISQISKSQLVKMERLKACIAEDGFDYLIQPQINLVTKDVIGYEVIMRWPYSKTEDLSQAQLQEIATQSGDAFKVFQLLLNTAINWLEMLDSKGALKPVSINFESLELLDEVTIEHIEQELKKKSIQANYLMISISEHLLLSVGDKVQLAFDQLKQVGTLLSINDFSGSYEALRYVRKLTVDQIRISCESLMFKDNREPEKAITNALIHLANVIELPLVGTHINSASVELLFRELAGENAQGEIIAPAVLYTDAPQWLDKWLAHQKSSNNE